MFAEVRASRAAVDHFDGQAVCVLGSVIREQEAGPELITALMELHPTITPIEFAWLMRQLGRETELITLLDAVHPTPWLKAARAVTRGDHTRALAIVSSIGAPSVEAYTRLRVAEELASAGRHAEAREQCAPAADFYRGVGATRYIAQAEDLVAEAG